MFNERRNEVAALLDQAVKDMAGEPVYTTSPEDQKKTRDTLSRYFDFRQRALEDALKLLNDDSRNAKDQTDQWRKHLLKAGSEGSQMISDSIKDIKRKSVFVDIVARVAFLESVFFTRLAHMTLPDAMQGKLIEYRKQFEVEKKNLMQKWEDLIARDKGIDEKMDSATKQLFQVYQEGLKKVDAANTKTRENITTYVTGAHMADSAANPATPSLLEPVKIMMETINNFMVTSKEMSNRFDALFKSEESVVVILFGKTRASVKEFLEKTNLDKAKKEYESAEKEIQNVAKSMETKGMQEDALRFVNEGAKITRDHLEDFTKAYNEFVNAFKEIFIGPVGDRTVEDLVERQRWDWAKNEWQKLNIQSELKKIYDDAREWWAIDIDGLDEANRKKLEELLEAERKRLEPALREASDNSALDSLKLIMTIAKNDLVDKVKSLTGWNK
ncbi:MAG TPA: hypothetical protein VKZ75_01820 [Cyclobacteriaceae bacterium]|nr:hypothetical protein [Cyclobacteriaceae bacterium]